MMCVLLISITVWILYLMFLNKDIKELKYQIELLWNCIDNNRRRLTKLEEQSNQAYVELFSETIDLRKLMDNKTKDSHN